MKESLLLTPTLTSSANNAFQRGVVAGTCRAVSALTNEFQDLLDSARIDERKNQSQVAAARLVRLAAHITQDGLTAVEAVELLRQEAEAIEHQAQELH